MPRKTILAERGSHLKSAIHPEAIKFGQARQANEIHFQTMVQTAVRRAFAGTPVECHTAEPGEEADFALHRGGPLHANGDFVGPDIQLAGMGFSLPIDVKWLSAERGRKLAERFKQRLVPQVAKYVGGRVFTRLQMDEFVEHPAPPAERAVMITNAVMAEVTIENARARGVHTLSVNELERLVDHVPGLALIDKRKAERILREEKGKILRHFGLREFDPSE